VARLVEAEVERAACRVLGAPGANTAALRPGQLIAVDGRAAARGALTLVTGSETVEGQTLLRTTALWLSIASSPTGISGLSAAGAPVSGAVTLSAAEVRRGWADDRRLEPVVLPPEAGVVGPRAVWSVVTHVRFEVVVDGARAGHRCRRAGRRAAGVGGRPDPPRGRGHERRHLALVLPLPPAPAELRAELRPGLRGEELHGCPAAASCGSTSDRATSSAGETNSS
jgi:hypothetical protein